MPKANVGTNARQDLFWSSQSCLAMQAGCDMRFGKSSIYVCDPAREFNSQEAALIEAKAIRQQYCVDMHCALAASCMKHASTVLSGRNSIPAIKVYSANSGR